MRKYKAGLHKDVPAIFDGVWNPETDNYQQASNAPAAIGVEQFEPAPLAVNVRYEPRRSGGIFRACKEASEFLFHSSSRARRERKRLSSISRHLMINIPS